MHATRVRTFDRDGRQVTRAECVTCGSHGPERDGGDIDVLAVARADAGRHEREAE
ncbi:hypothetical protein [Egibacter rhizosphaerae]|uniref:hypothetical protein n=1 Tax=Egibacter rhizosphaerae TaxID=1670831 RepID=UPI0013F170B0|nr:hypothetical protein [Egibacter rhizosphaerae]